MPEPEQLSLGLDAAGAVGLPAQLEPMRARPASEPFDSPDYLFETWWNGVRVLASIAHGRVRLHNRRLGDLLAHFPELEPLGCSVGEQPAMLDGEIVIVDERGKPDQDALQRRLRLTDPSAIEAEAMRQPACLLVSDILFRGRRWLLTEPLQRRKRILADAVHPADCVYLAESFQGEGRALFEAAIESQLEGILAKPKDSLYQPGGFAGQWLAIGHERKELVVGGFSLHIAGGERAIELVLGGYDSGQLVFVTSAPPPMEERARAELLALLNALQIDAPPFANSPPFIACWVQPDLVLTVRSSRRSGSRQMRFPAVERIRLDISPDDCLLASGAEAGVSLPDPAGEAHPRLTMLNTLALPFEGPPAQPTPRPRLRLVEGS
jgi:bifunctional non-homologous end joining protein LigD